MSSEKTKKIVVVLAIIFVVILVFSAVYYILAEVSKDDQRQTEFGLTFSKKFAQQLKLDWQESYIATLDEIKPKYLRIPTYWENIEPTENNFNFADVDWQVEEAAKRGIKMTIVVGRRQPRWPECHDPSWVQYKTIEETRTAILRNIATVVEHYKNNPYIEIWQVENEPFLDFFGECPKMTKAELQEEINLVKSLDQRHVLITDSGELSTWYPTIKMGDLFGTTLYRITWNKYIGYWKYFFVPASYYRVKTYLWGRPTETSFVAELQAEPWFPHGPLNMPLADHYKTMNSKLLIENAQYAKQTNFARAYFWGVEWWYWLKKVHKDDSLWQAAQIIFN